MTSGNWLFKMLLPGAILLAGETALANKGKLMIFTHPNRYVQDMKSVCDSLPQNKNVAENAADDKQPPVIKEVPKSKKQAVPMVVPSSVKIVRPVKVIKPKIIKPNIKLN
jgi:NDP-sugar pyrophosphorylase family protein